MSIFEQSFFKFFTFSLPIFFLFLSLASSTTTPPPPPSSAIAASENLRSRGYSLFAGIIAATDTTLWNGTGTILAPPDFAFAFATAKFSGNRAPPRPSTSLLLYHTLKQPLNFHDLAEIPNSGELVTFYQNYCVFESKNVNGELNFAESKKPITAVKIQQPDLYVDDRLAIHGVDGVMDPTSASKCGFQDLKEVEVKSEVDRSFLDHAVKVLRRRGFGVVATAMEIRRSELASLTAVTIFAPSDQRLFSESNGFRFDFRHHVVAKRLDSSDLATFPVGTEIKTVAPNKTVVIGSVDGAVTVDGAMVDGSVIYHNRWVTVVSISRTLDDNRESAGLLSPGPTDSGDSRLKSALPGGVSDSDHADFRSPPPSNQISGGVLVPDDTVVLPAPPSSQISGGVSDSDGTVVMPPPPSSQISGGVSGKDRNDVLSPPPSSQIPGGVSDSDHTDVQSPPPISQIPGEISDSGSAETPSPIPNHNGEVMEDKRRPPAPSPAESASTDLNSLARNLSKPGRSSQAVNNTRRPPMPSPALSHHREVKGNAVNNTRHHGSQPPPVESASTHLNASAPTWVPGERPMRRHFPGGIPHPGRLRTLSPAPIPHAAAKVNETHRHQTPLPSPSPVESASAPSFSTGKPISSHFSRGFSHPRHLRPPSPAPIHHGEAKGDVGKEAVTNDTSLHDPPSPLPAESASTPLNSPAPSFSGEIPENSQFSGSLGTPSSAPVHFTEGKWDGEDKSTRQPPSLPVDSASPDQNSAPAVSPVCSHGVVSSLSLKVEGEDLFCPLTIPAKAASDSDVAPSPLLVETDYQSE